jgi:hypothetical protein
VTAARLLRVERAKKTEKHARPRGSDLLNEVVANLKVS